MQHKMILPVLMKTCSHIVTVSEFSRQSILERFGLDPTKVTVVYEAASDRFRPTDDETVSTVKKKYNLPEKYILSLGALEPRKNLGRLLTAWSHISPDAKSGVSLVVAGEQHRIFADPKLGNARYLKNVVLTGYFPDNDLPALYSGAWAFVYPSIFEGFGLPPLEAMACGTPVLCSNATSLPEVVGDAAFTFNPYDVAAIEDALRQMLVGYLPHDEMRVLGLKRAKAFSWDKAARQIADILEGV